MFISIEIDENGKPFVSTSDKMEKPSRPNKGRSLISMPDTYTVIDIETTGLDSRFCEIIELSALRYSNGSLIDSFTTLVKPAEPIDDFITDLTGITNDLVSDAPAISDAIKNFYNFVGSDILVGYNVHFDINFIYDVLQDTHGLDFTNSFVDVMRFAKKLLPDLKNHKLETVADHYKVSSPAHRSYADCETATLVIKLCFLMQSLSMAILKPLKLPTLIISNYTLKTLRLLQIILIPTTRSMVSFVYLLALLRKWHAKTPCSLL